VLVARIDDRLRAALQALPPKPLDSAPQATKKQYSQKVSECVALVFAEELRERGLREARPAPPGVVGGSGAERRMAGGIGAKKVDVTWATEESGLLFAISVKSINFRDGKTKNFQKNLVNRRGDMLFESVTLHRRFPYAVLAGMIFLDRGAAEDNSDRRQSTFANAHDRLKLFTGRSDPAGRDEQYERLYLVLLGANPFDPDFKVYAVGESGQNVALEGVFDEFVRLIAERNPDFYDCADGAIVPLSHVSTAGRRREKGNAGPPPAAIAEPEIGPEEEETDSSDDELDPS
jgi:hypothetical protein